MLRQLMWISIENLVGSYRVRDLWAHVYEESVTGTYKAQIPAHGCKVVRLMQKDAPHPSEIFLIGKATPAYWNIDQASETLREDDGTFVYSGPLFRGEIRFVSERDWHSVNYMPEHNGTWLTDGNKVEVFNGDPHELTCCKLEMLPVGSRFHRALPYENVGRTLLRINNRLIHLRFSLSAKPLLLIGI